MESRLIAAAGDTAQKVENEELKSVLVREKEESEKVGLKLNVKKKNHGIWSITSWQVDGDKGETVRDFIFWLQSHFGW